MSNTGNLHKIFDLQHTLNLALGIDMRRFNKHEKVEFAQKLMIALHQEVSEATDCLPWKWWNHNQPSLDIPHIQEEIIDIFHFIICLAQLFNMSSDDFYRMYLEKNITNLERIKNHD